MLVLPDYDEAFLDWAFFPRWTCCNNRATPVRSLVRDAAGRFLGWYLDYRGPGGLCSVIQIATRPGAEGKVLDHLFHDAYRNGAIAVRGRVEPRLLEPLSLRGCVLRYLGGSVIHARDPRPAGDPHVPRSPATYLEGQSRMTPALTVVP